MTTLWLKIAMAAGVLAALTGGVWWLHHTWWGAGYAACGRQDHAAIVQAQHHAATVTTRVITRYITRTRVIDAQTRVLIRKVPVYVTAHDNARCRINVGFVSVWNGATRGVLPAAASSADAAASPVQLSDVATQHVRDAQVCRASQAQLTALQDWVRGVTHPSTH